MRGDRPLEWGGLYLRSEAEMRIAQALNETEVLFFANARGRHWFRWVGSKKACRTRDTENLFLIRSDEILG